MKHWPCCASLVQQQDPRELPRCVVVHPRSHAQAHSRAPARRHLRAQAHMC
jgi:hypothetical protein